MKKQQQVEEPQKSYEEVKEENERYAESLSKRSEQYIFELKKTLSLALNVEDQERRLNKILPYLIEEQRKGKTARQLFGPVDDFATLVIEGPKDEKQEEMPFWQMWLDNSLLIFVILGLIGGGVSLFSKTPMVIGISSMIVSSVIGGLVFWAMYHLIYQYDRPGADRSKKPKTWKSIIIILGLMLIWIAVLQGSMLLFPSSINRPLTPIWMLIIAALVYGCRYVLKRTLGYSGSFFNR